MSIRTLMLGALLWFGCASSTGPSELFKVTGTLTYPQHTVLPPDAVVYISLVDVSPRQDASADIVARQTIKQPGQTPISFELDYNPAQIKANHLYAIQVVITAKDELRLTNASPYPVITKGNPCRVNVVVGQVNLP